MEPKLYDKTANISNILSYVGKAIDANVDLVAFPELALTGYMCRQRFFDLAETIPGPSTLEIMKRLKGGKVYVTLGMPEVKGGFVYNSAPVFGPGGLVGVWRKLYLPTHITTKATFEEGMFFKQGSDIITFDTEFGKIGIEICYEFWYPEITRIQALKGAWLLLNLSAGPVGFQETFQLLARVRALENRAWFGVVNQVGLQEGTRFGGGTCIVNHLGEIEKSASSGESAREEIVEFEVDNEAVCKERLSLSFLRDVRPEILRKAAEIAAEL
jgi:predicted amidohydrolase